MKNNTYKLAILLILCLLQASIIFSQSNHKELNGWYSNGSSNIYFNNGDCYLFNSNSDNSFKRQEHFKYKYQNKKIIFKYTGDFQQKYNGNNVTKIWWRLTDERFREKKAHLKIESLQEWLEKRYKNFASYYANKLHKLVLKEIPTISKIQFQECLNYKGFVRYLNIENYKMSEKILISKALIKIYNSLKKENKLKGESKEKITTDKKVSSSNNFKIKWSDWIYIRIDGNSEQKSTFNFGSYFFPGKKLTAKEKMFRAKRKPNIKLFISGELFKEGKIIGRFTNDGSGKTTTYRETSLTQSTWHNVGGTFQHQGKSFANGLRYFDTKWKDLIDGIYKIIIYVKEKDVSIRKKEYSFKISQGIIKGDNSISLKDFKKKHNIKRFDGIYVFLSAVK